MDWENNIHIHQLSSWCQPMHHRTGAENSAVSDLLKLWRLRLSAGRIIRYESRLGSSEELKIQKS